MHLTTDAVPAYAQQYAAPHAAPVDPLNVGLTPTGVPAPAPRPPAVARLPRLLQYTFDSNPRKFVTRLCRFVVCTRGPQDEPSFATLVRRVDLPALFPTHDWSSAPWSTLANRAWKKAVKGVRVKDRDTLPLFLVIPQVAERVPPADLLTRRQRLEHAELAFVLRTVVLKAVDAMEDGEPGAV